MYLFVELGSDFIVSTYQNYIRSNILIEIPKPSGNKENEIAVTSVYRS